MTFKFRHKTTGEIMTVKAEESVKSVLDGSPSWEQVEPKPEKPKAKKQTTKK